MTPLLLLASTLAVASPSVLSTTAEQSRFTTTGRYDEAVRLCGAFAAAYPSRARCVTFGASPEGRELKALVLSDDGALDPEAARARGRPVILAQGGIHAGEIDGKDAGFLVVRELLEGKTAPGALAKVTFVFVPIFNVDGHERFGKNNRPNQRGPEEMGWRTTAQNLNLNRDYAKAEAPEMHAMLRLLSSWDPVVYVDLHVTDGAKFQHDVSVIVDPAEGGPEPLMSTAKALRGEIVARLNARGRAGGHDALDFYPSFEAYEDPASGFARGVAPPRLSTPYWSQHNRIGILVETHSWKDYKTRVRATHDVLEHLLVLATTQANAWAEAARAVDAAVAKGGADVVIEWDNTDETITIDFKGYEYVREPSPISGALRTIYEEGKPVVWRLPMKPGVKPKTVVKAPGGYVVPAAHAAWIKGKLALHGIRYRELSSPLTIDGEAFRATTVTFGSKPYEARMTAKVTGAWAAEKRAVPRGSLFVPTAQPLGRLVVHLFEPAAPDSFVSWGFWNAAFEQKEYMESYVAEGIAEQMLKDPKVRAEFAALVEKDPEFARDPERRLDFFYRKHPSWDERVNLYPVLRVASEPGR